jgi:putative hydrolase of the HAD superfamily
MRSDPVPLRFALIDLDETLYPAQAGLMAEIGRRINQYLGERCGFGDSEIAELRDRYYRQYGTTLRGLMLHHHVDADDYLAYVHDVPLERYIGPNPELQAALAGLPLTKVIFTNASEAHARRVLSLLGVERYFSAIIGIEAIQYLNKPDPQAYRKALEILGAEPEECLLLDDIERNLAPAREMGMVTVLVGAGASSRADFVIPSVEQVSDVLARLDGRIPGSGRE